ncbi:MAG: hypothetical protein L0H63_10390 [Nitrococcus sp.]|nr:hypothetical protein [Nitrococcus sp.]
MRAEVAALGLSLARAEYNGYLLNCLKTLVRFLASEGADGHCAMIAHSLLRQRMFDWLDDVFGHARGHA